MGQRVAVELLRVGLVDHDARRPPERGVLDLLFLLLGEFQEVGELGDLLRRDHARLRYVEVLVRVERLGRRGQHVGDFRGGPPGHLDRNT
ncbi:hypothetical protein [Streptomyces sp. NPDC096033]|uniref:hypothetical protein n=1 Tax=Streptomyces sp. NPDC096033 TaxID=3366071 RepID=UPI0037FE1855